MYRVVVLLRFVVLCCSLSDVIVVCVWCVVFYRVALSCIVLCCSAVF